MLVLCIQSNFPAGIKSWATIGLPAKRRWRADSGPLLEVSTDLFETIFDVLAQGYTSVIGSIMQYCYMSREYPVS